MVGAGLAPVAAVEKREADSFDASPATWVLQGAEQRALHDPRRKVRLLAPQQGLGRAESDCAVLILMSKSKAWWELALDERRAIFEDRSQHVTIGARSLPAVARRLFHGRDLGAEFDFLTWFEFAKADTQKFDELVGALRATEEWKYVTREVEVRLVRST